MYLAKLPKLNVPINVSSIEINVSSYSTEHCSN